MVHLSLAPSSAPPSAPLFPLQFVAMNLGHKNAIAGNVQKSQA